MTELIVGLGTGVVASKILGPTADYLGDKLKELTKKR